MKRGEKGGYNEADEELWKVEGRMAMGEGQWADDSENARDETENDNQRSTCTSLASIPHPSLHHSPATRAAAHLHLNTVVRGCVWCCSSPPVLSARCSTLPTPVVVAWPSAARRRWRTRPRCSTAHVRSDSSASRPSTRRARPCAFSAGTAHTDSARLSAPPSASPSTLTGSASQPASRAVHPHPQPLQLRRHPLQTASCC